MDVKKKVWDYCAMMWRSMSLLHLVREMSYVTQEGILKALRLVLFG